jgi:hypothetical protein
MKKMIFAALLLTTLVQISAAREALIQTGHTHDILAVKFSPNDAQLISYSWGDGRLCLWDLSTGYLIWMAKTEFIQKSVERYNLQEFHWSQDMQLIITKSENGTYQTWDIRTGEILSVSEQPPNAVLFPEKENKFSVINDHDSFYLTDPESKATISIKSFSRTSDVYDVSHNGSFFAEGGSWGNAAIKVTELKTGKARFFIGFPKGKHPVPYHPGALEIRMTNEKWQRRAAIEAAKSKRDKQASIDNAVLMKQVYISFEHYGDMKDPGEQRMVESNEPNMSKIMKTAQEAKAIWLRLHNDSYLPIRIPTQSVYLPDKNCFYELSNGRKEFGLCDGKEISIWHGLENKNGKQIPYGFDFGSSAILLPDTSVVFAVPRIVLGNGNAIRFDFSFLKETDDKKLIEYGAKEVMRFRESDLAKTGN